MYKSIPTYDSNLEVWTHTDFDSKEEYLKFLWTLWKEPGKYKFDKTSLEFNRLASNFNRDGFYCNSPKGTYDFKLFWDTEKEKCRKGVIFKSKKGTWFIPREYYMWLNFLPIFDKEEQKFGFAKVRDAQYHIALYEELAMISNKNAAILKKRQIASSYYHAARIINLYYFEEGAVCKIAGSLENYINNKGTWRFLEEYRNFLNNYTAWYRPSNPDKVLNWEQKIEVNKNGRKQDVGLKSTVLGLVLDKDPSNGVGGPCTFFFHEEAGIAGKMNETIEFLIPALKSGMNYTGFYAVAGSVGDLDQCEPLKNMILHPATKDILAVETNLLNENNETAMCGLFIPEQWSMLPCIDEYGNSLVEQALEMILQERIVWKKELKDDDYQLRISQKPINIEEAFAYRNSSRFPLHLVKQQIRRIENKEYFSEYLDLERDEKNKIIAKPSKQVPISDFPISPKLENKEGVLVVYERPIKDPSFGCYYASIDPVSAGKTTTSKSLCSIIIYKTTQEITVRKADGSTEQVIEQDKIVATWCGRFDNETKNHERLESIIEWYNAWTLIENNVSLFIQYMIEKRKTKYLIPKNQIQFLKEISSNTNVFQEYGWRNVGTIFKDNLIPYGVQFLEEELDKEVLPDGTILNIKYGIERIPDIMILKEMIAYREGVNVDRLISFCALAAFARIQESNRGYLKRVEYEHENLHKPQKHTILSREAFNNIGSKKNIRRPFKNIK